ncbi:hypothetical protein ACO0QE_004315 [Hanseniaspora vineae]
MVGRLASLSSSGNGSGGARRPTGANNDQNNNNNGSSGQTTGADNGSKAKPGLKFKPKLVARKSKAEREAEQLKNQQKLEEEKLKAARHNEKNRYSKKLTNNGKRVPSGPKGVSFGSSFSSGSTSGGSVISELMGNSKLTATILDSKDSGDDDDSDSDTEGGFKAKKYGAKGQGADEDEPIESSKKRDGTIRINMSKEFKIHEIMSDDENDDDDEDDEDSGNEVNDLSITEEGKIKQEPGKDGDGDVEMKQDNEETDKKQDLSYLFPVRPIRVKHEDVELAKQELQDSYSLPNTREPTPGMVKQEETEDPNQTGLRAVENQERALMRKRQLVLEQKVKAMHLDKDFHSVDEAESLEEKKMIVKDYLYLKRKLNKIHNQDRQFLALQLPPQLPFDTAGEQNALQEQPNIQGNIGQLRVHKSGKITIKIGKVVMDVSKGSETSFIQDVVAVDTAEEENTVEHLGQIAGKMVVTPRF